MWRGASGAAAPSRSLVAALLAVAVASPAPAALVPVRGTGGGSASDGPEAPCCAEPEAPFSCCRGGARQAAPAAPAYPGGPPPVPTPEAVPGGAPLRFQLRAADPKGLRWGSASQGAGARCLSAIAEDSLGGLGLAWRECVGQGKGASPGLRAGARTGAPPRAAQEFLLLPGGQLQGSASGLCVRRARCATVFVYDLGACDGPEAAAVFWASKPLANSLDRMRPLGSPAEALATELCQELCGPYHLLERCRAQGLDGEDVAACRRSWQAPPGWTKKVSHDLGSQGAPGSAKPGSRSLPEALGWRDRRLEDAEMSGLGSTGDSALCGSYVTDGAALGSVFYLRRAAGP